MMRLGASGSGYGILVETQGHSRMVAILQSVDVAVQLRLPAGAIMHIEKPFVVVGAALRTAGHQEVAVIGVPAADQRCADLAGIVALAVAVVAVVMVVAAWHNPLPHTEDGVLKTSCIVHLC